MRSLWRVLNTPIYVDVRRTVAGRIICAVFYVFMLCASAVGVLLFAGRAGPWILGGLAVYLVVSWVAYFRRANRKGYPRWGGDWDNPGALVPSPLKPRAPILHGKREEEPPIED